MHCRLDHSKHGLNKKICAKALCLSASAPGPSEAGAQRARQAPKERPNAATDRTRRIIHCISKEPGAWTIS